MRCCRRRLLLTLFYGSTRGMIAEEKCTGIAVHAFYELQGLKYEATERYVGKTDRAG